VFAHYCHRRQLGCALSSAVEKLQRSDRASAAAEPADARYENRLVEVRLGIASSLFAALRSKNAATAAHSLRVALGCSSWSFALQLADPERDQLEVAALLHDIGKIAVPDRILLKPSTLLPDEAALMERHHAAGMDILSLCCSSPVIVEIVRHLPAWYDGTRRNHPIGGNSIPLGSRILAIVDAFDSMTSDQVYRRAMSHERALNELFSCAGTQFDPELVRLFSEVHNSQAIQEQVARHWLEQLEPEQSNGLWQLNQVQSGGTALIPEVLFQQKMLDNMHDAVVFVDRNLQIMLWNRGAERLTGIAGASVYQRNWLPSLVGMCDSKGEPLADADCPVTYALHSGVQSLRRLLIAGRNARPVAVDIHAVPVVSADGIMHGAAVVLHDASPEASLEQRCQSLHERATKDPLTQVANRAEFDRTHNMFVAAHVERQLPCSLIICDIDHFKSINDTYGHPAGDEALKSFAQLLKSFCRPGDLVARYGGEEFVVLCADCNNATAAGRAEQMRRAIAELTQPALEGESITVSFGVTEIQAGDTADTMLRRADRALLEAKQKGRNIVVQLGAGNDGPQEQPVTRFSWFQKRTPHVLLEKTLLTSVPLKVAIEKLRGFVADHFAEITTIVGDRVCVKIDGERTPLVRRRADRPVPFLVEFQFSEETFDPPSGLGGKLSRTRMQVTVRPRRDRDRRRADAVERARYVMASIKSYLMATEELEPQAESTFRQASNLLAPWLHKKQ